MKKVATILLIFGAFTLFAKGLETEEERKAIERAHVSITEIQANFQKTMAETLRRSGPGKSLPSCRVDATGNAKGIVVGRTSLRLRNPKNAPPEWVKPYLEEFSTLKPERVPSRKLVNLGKNHYGYLEPIFVEPICLNCHGTQINPEVHESLRQQYPADKAVGFSEGDLRGVIWLEMNQ